MSQIEVPDWVARIADEAGEEFDRTHTMSMYASLADMQLDCVRHMVTAALGAWVVPVGWMDPDDGSIVCEYHEHEPRYVSYTQPLFALRQEKPD